MAGRGLGYWILSVLGGAVAGAVFGWVPTVGGNWPRFVYLGGGVIIFIALGGVPWIVLSRRWVWWLGSVIGAIVGVVAIGFTIIALFGLGLNICLDGSGCPPPPPFPSTENLVFFTLLIGLFGAGQALTLRGWSRKLGWFITSVIAGAVFGETLQVVSTIVGSNPATPGIGPSIGGGVACGAILGAGMLLLRRQAMT
jgi:hypothetical protein